MEQTIMGDLSDITWPETTTDDSCPTEKGPSKPHCCTFYEKPNFEGESEDFCIVLESDKEQKMYDLRGL